MSNIKYTQGSHFQPYLPDTRHFADLGDFSLQDLQSSLFKLRQVATNRFIPFPCLHSTTNEKAESCKKPDCKIREIKFLFKDECIGDILDEVIQTLSVIAVKVKRNEKGLIDITNIFNKWFFNRDIYLLQCGHGINAAKISDLLSRKIDSHLIQRISNESRRFFGCYTCTDERIYKANKIVIPNFSLRYVATILEELFKEMRIGHDLPRPTMEVPENPFDAEEFVHEFDENNFTEESKQEIVQLAGQLSWENLEDLCARALNSGKDSLTFYLFLNAAEYAREEEGEESQHFLMHVSNLLIQKLEANLPSTIEPVTVEHVSKLIAGNVFLLRIARECGLDVIFLKRYQEAANKIINSPYMIEGLTASAYKNLEFLVELYPCIADRLCGLTEDQENCVLVYERDRKVPVSNFESFTVLYSYTNFIDRAWPDEIQTKERVIQTGFHLHRLYSWLIDSILDGTIPIGQYPENVRKSICIRLLSFSEKNTIIDLRLLSLLYMFKETFNNPSNEELELLQSWIGRCLQQAQNPDNVPNILSVIEEADKFVHVCADKLKCKISQDYYLNWAEFYSKSNKSLRKAISLYTANIWRTSDHRTLELVSQLLHTAVEKHISISFYEAERLMDPILANVTKHPGKGEILFFNALKNCLNCMKHVPGDLSPFLLLEKLLLATVSVTPVEYKEFNIEYRNLIISFQNHILAVIDKLPSKPRKALFIGMYNLIMKPTFPNYRTVADESLRDFVVAVFNSDKSGQLIHEIRNFISQVIQTDIYKEFQGKWWRIMGTIYNSHS